jgi:hypothetical protein
MTGVIIAVWLVGGMLLAWPISGLVVREIRPNGATGDAFLVGFVTLMALVSWPLLVGVWGFGRWAIRLQEGLDDE